jgi:hypothetical protein
MTSYDSSDITCLPPPFLKLLYASRKLSGEPSNHCATIPG